MPDKTHYDVIVIGAGPAGYVAAIRCAQLGLSVAVVEQWTDRGGRPALGGTCLNVGCIPSKALLDSSERYHALSHGAANHGIKVGRLSMDIAAMQARKAQVVRRLTDGIAGLFKANAIVWLRGRGKLLANKRVAVTAATGDQAEYNAEHVIIAAGSVPIDIPAAPLDHERIVDSSGALEFTRVPKTLAVIGAGVIGLELGSVWSRLGAKVVMLEALDDFLAMADRQIAREALKAFTAQGLDIRLSAKVTAAKVTKNAVSLRYQAGGKERGLDVERVLVAVGRRPNTRDIAEPAAGLKLDARGFIETRADFMTNIAGVYAVGDCVAGPMLAHKGSEEGVAAAETIAGQQSVVDHNIIPSVVYTEPEIAWVGMTEHAAQAAGHKVNTGAFPFAATGRALAVDAAVGFAKVVADARNDRVLGVHIIGKDASELIAEAVTVMAYDGSAEDIARTVHAHPTMSEAIHEAALDVAGVAIHKAGARKARSKG